MRFLADMGVSQRVVSWLREQGHEAVHLKDEGLQRSPDREIFKKAIAEERVVLTFDLDFGEIAALSEGEKCAVIIFRLRDATAAHVTARLAPVLEASSSRLAHGAVVVVEETRHRIRSLPIGED